MKKVLIIANICPYKNESGSLRITNFYKYLHESNWSPFVLCRKKLFEKSTKHHQIIHTYDIFFIQLAKTKKQLLQKSSKSIFQPKNIIRSIYHTYLFFFPDLYVGWIPHSVLRGKKLILEKNIDLIFASSLPPSSLIIGYILHKITKVPFVVDYRDSWINNPNFPHKSPLIKFFEKQIIESSELVTCVTPDILKELSNRYPNHKNKVKLLPNGFDSNEMNLEQIVLMFEKFTITYTGKLGGTRSPKLFLLALNNLISKGMIVKDDINVKFYGSERNIIEQILDLDSINCNLKDYVYIYNRIERNKVINYMKSSHLLLLIENSNSYTTKVFEYLALNKPILALIRYSELINLIDKYSYNSKIVNMDSLEEIENAIIYYYKLWKKECKIKYYNHEVINQNFFQDYDRKNQTAILAQYMDEIIKKKS